MAAPIPENRGAIIQAVTTPLGFIVLLLLVVEALLGGLAIALPEFRPALVYTIIVAFPVFLLAVIGLAVWRGGEALRGEAPSLDRNAKRLADDLVLALDGPFSNMQPAEREEAWVTLAEVLVMSAEQENNRSYLNFCETVAKRLRTQVELKGKYQKTQGVVPTSPKSDAGS